LRTVFLVYDTSSSKTRDADSRVNSESEVKLLRSGNNFAWVETYCEFDITAHWQWVADDTQHRAVA